MLKYSVSADFKRILNSVSLCMHTSTCIMMVQNMMLLEEEKEQSYFISWKTEKLQPGHKPADQQQLNLRLRHIAVLGQNFMNKRPQIHQQLLLQQELQQSRCLVVQDLLQIRQKLRNQKVKLRNQKTHKPLQITKDNSISKSFKILKA